MVENTNLEYCKKIAIAFLHQPILPTNLFGVITHPVFESNFVVGMNEDGTQANGLVDLLKDKKMLINLFRGLYLLSQHYILLQDLINTEMCIKQQYHQMMFLLIQT